MSVQAQNPRLLKPSLHYGPHQSLAEATKRKGTTRTAKQREEGETGNEAKRREKGEAETGEKTTGKDGKSK